MRRFLVIAMAVLIAALGACTRRTADGGFRLVFIPKIFSIPYFFACKRGAEEAAKELGIVLDYKGPNKADANVQIDLLNQIIASGDYQGIAIACNDPARVGSVLKRAQNSGLRVITYDADADEGRSFFVNQATYDAVAREMVEAMAEELQPKGVGKVALLTSSITAPNQSEWARRMKSYAAEHYPRMQLLPETEHGEDREPGISKARDLIQAHPDLKGIIGLTSVAVPAAAEAVRQEKKQGQIKVTGVSTPRDMREYLKDGTVNTVILWNPIDLGYLTVHVANFVRQDKMPAGGSGTIRAGRLGEIQVRNHEVLLGNPIRFTKANVDQFDF
jgi:rhamnose transport system substrate-binding protein